MKYKTGDLFYRTYPNETNPEDKYFTWLVTGIKSDRYQYMRIPSTNIGEQYITLIDTYEEISLYTSSLREDL